MQDFGFSTRELGERHRRSRHEKRSSRGSPLLAKGRDWKDALIRWIKTPRTRREWKILFFKTCGWGAGALVLFLLIIWFTLPNIDDPKTLFASQSTVIADRNGVELYRVFSGQDRTYIPFDHISNGVKKATIAIEDERFLDRGCFDVIGFSRAVLSQFLPGILVRSGGSTLTQQFAGNALVGRNRSVVRKVREYMLACELERKYNKDQLLELYLNWIPYGENAYGVEQASHRYFGTGAVALSLAQSAVLAALPQRPSYFSPYGSHVRTTVTDDVYADIVRGKITESSDISDRDVTIGLLGQDIGTGSHLVYVGGRTDQVLDNMQKLDLITEKEKVKALADLKVMVFTRTRENIRAPHFVLAVRDQVQSLLNNVDEETLNQGGFTVTTTLDWRLQEVAEKIIKGKQKELLDRFGAHNAALLSMNPTTREILAYVGNVDYESGTSEGKIDMVMAPRQPGSSFKPFIYAKAFENGFNPATVIYDVPTKIGDDQPDNYDGTYEGLMSMRTALAHSRNVPAAKTFFLAGGEDQILPFVESIGITTPSKQKEEIEAKRGTSFDYGWPLALGAAEVPLYEMVQGYATFADGGMYRPPVTILKITDRQGNILYQAKEAKDKQVLDPRIAYQISSVLSDNNARPANQYWKDTLTVPGITAAAKTGTSNKCLERDKNGGCTNRRPESNWTMGFSPTLVTGVWVGNATSQSLAPKADGLSSAAPMWKQFMISAHKILKASGAPFPRPDGLIEPQISKLSGELPTTCTPVELRRSDLFLDDHPPTKEDPACQLLKVDKVTNLLASAACPEDAVEEKAFFLPSSEQPLRWPLWEQSVQSWAKKEMEKWNASPDHSGSTLPLPLAPTESCDPAKTPGRSETPTISILTPSEGASMTFPAFQADVHIGSLAKISKVEFFVDDLKIRTEENPLSKNLTVSIRMPRNAKKEGNHVLKVSVTNEYFTEAHESVSFTFGEELKAREQP